MSQLFIRVRTYIYINYIFREFFFILEDLCIFIYLSSKQDLYESYFDQHIINIIKPFYKEPHYDWGGFLKISL